MANKKTTRRALVLSVISLILCCAMFVGTTFAWFTDSVTSGGNIISSGTLDVTLEYKGAADTEWKDASTGAIFDHKHWEPGYTDVKYVKISNVGNLAFKFQLNIVPTMTPAAGEVNLADVIDVYMIPGVTTIDRAAVAAATPVGTLAQLMAETDGAAHGVILPAEDEAYDDHVEAPADAEKETAEYTIVLKMQESAGNEYQNLSVGGDFSVQLLATQYTWENDSFDHTYDSGAEYNGTPIAKVTEMPEDKLNVSIPLYSYGSFSNTGVTQTGLDVGFVFETTETVEEAMASEYANWHADFVVSFDKPIATGTAGLAGQYDFWSMDWVGFEAFDVDTSDTVDGIPAGMACRLLEGKGVYINYTELCRDIKTFNCGVFNKDAANVGTTITVELRLYETKDPADTANNTVNEETGNFVTVATYTYTFE